MVTVEREQRIDEVMDIKAILGTALAAARSLPLPQDLKAGLLADHLVNTQGISATTAAELLQIDEWQVHYLVKLLNNQKSGTSSRALFAEALERIKPQEEPVEKASMIADDPHYQQALDVLKRLPWQQDAKMCALIRHLVSIGYREKAVATHFGAPDVAQHLKLAYQDKQKWEMLQREMRPNLRERRLHLEFCTRRLLENSLTPNQIGLILGKTIGSIYSCVKSLVDRGEIPKPTTRKRDPTKPYPAVTVILPQVEAARKENPKVNPDVLSAQLGVKRWAVQHAVMHLIREEKVQSRRPSHSRGQPSLMSKEEYARYHARILELVEEGGHIGRVTVLAIAQEFGRPQGTVSASISREAKRKGVPRREQQRAGFEQLKARVLAARVDHPDLTNKEILEFVGLSRHRGQYKKAIRELAQEGNISFRDSTFHQKRSTKHQS